MSPKVKTEQGILQGKECTTYYGKKYYSFEGIPYAKAPVGKLRFRNPEKPESWSGVRVATSPGNRCIQLNPYSSTPLEGSEDCLYLNVYTPVLPHDEIEKLPVIFFVHGGRLIFGYGDYYNPDYFLRHDVILVTINYRLNILGFVCLNIPEAPGNVGLKDTVMALRWVNKNIINFNGDPNNVTVFGESAGAAVVSSYLTSKMAEGLFAKVIAQSGNLLSDLYMRHEDPIEKAKNVASVLGEDIDDPKSLYEFLVNVPIDDLIYAFTTTELNRPPGIINAYFLPVVEQKFDNVEQFFTEYPLKCINENRHAKMPVLAGCNSFEAAMFLRKDDDGKIQYETDFYYFIPHNLFIERDSAKARDFIAKLKAFYLNNREPSDETKVEYLNMVSDCYFQRDVYYFNELVSKSNPLYFFKFDFFGNLNTRVIKSLGIKGASHGDMIQYQFYRKNKASQCTERDQRIIDFFSEAWCNFAKYGMPTWKDQKVKWLPYQTEAKHTLIVDEQIKLTKDADLDRLKFCIEMVKERCKL
ncbi:esterase FE4 [Manduca sexta]|uniref:Esterase n=1 Tax=Manduca sexta TaxID=7130 RepID=A0A921ZAS6_MANSE|nr:esterase FE4 [Manduca sexta]KAG6454586.1 hypothetical protein O3G_MSEX008776 [Manduca sexta]KAG6454587.1 hypothetical protein O3G_MSEX008776 [Manduca sexta]KAG6454588.1 hypothetical protein O3G_MSEX008776 [Manduca sexta]UXP71967.1 esterase [Manduca sexta]